MPLHRQRREDPVAREVFPAPAGDPFASWPAAMYIRLLYCQALRKGRLDSRWRTANSSGRDRDEPYQTPSCLGSPERCVTRSIAVVCSVATGSLSRKSGR